jgi:hypothetical protein
MQAPLASQTFKVQNSKFKQKSYYFEFIILNFELPRKRKAHAKDKCAASGVGAVSGIREGGWGVLVSSPLL